MTRLSESNIRHRLLGLAAVAAVGITAASAPAAAPAVIYSAYNADAGPGPNAPDPFSADGGSWARSVNVSPSANGGLTFGPGAEPGSGVRYWNVTDKAGPASVSYTLNGTTTTGNGTNGSQNYSKTGGAFTDALATTGWIATATMKVAASAGPTAALTYPNPIVGQPAIPLPNLSAYNAGTFFDVRNGHRIYTLGVINDGTRQGLYYLPDGSNAVVSDTNSSFSTLIRAFDVGADYFTLRMYYSPNPLDPTHAGGVASYDGDVVSVYINDEATPAYTYNAVTNGLAATVYNNPALGRSGVYRELVGSAAQGDLQTVNYRYFDLMTPEPATLAALALPGLVFARRGRNKR